MNLEVNGFNVILVVLIPFLVSLLLVPIFKKVSIHVNAMDIPNERKVHKVPMPRLGGLAIFFSFMIGYMLFARENTIMLSILIGSFCLIIMGLVDSINELKARYQLIVQLIASAIVVFYGGLVLNEVSLFGHIFSFPVPLNYIITILFLMGFINVMNLIDGLDGLCGGLSSIYFITIAIIAFIMDKAGGMDVILCLIMLGSTLGFLVYNFNPASIYLGQAGSDFLGFIIGVTALYGFKGATFTSIIIPVLIMAIPIFDTALAILRRLLKGESIGTPDKEHFHHQLLKMKFSTKTTVLIIYGIDILFACVSIFFALGDKKIALILLAILSVLLLIIVMFTDILFDHKSKKNRK